MQKITGFLIKYWLIFIAILQGYFVLTETGFFALTVAIVLIFILIHIIMDRMDKFLEHDEKFKMALVMLEESRENAFNIAMNSDRCKKRNDES